MEPTELSEFIEGNRDKFINVASRIWNFSETKFEERRSVDLLCSNLKQEGFLIERGSADIDTAFVATYGSGKPIVGILCEYDALSGLSQKGSTPRQLPLINGGNGHGCGHNLFAAGALAAAIAIQNCLKTHRIQGTIRLYGCPAEEGGSGKAFMAREGVFDDLDFALAWHPSTMNYVVSLSTLANCQVVFKFRGKSAHSSMNPHLGRSALDAVELMNVGVNYLREHVKTDTRISYAITDMGGTSPNVVQANASVLYLIRAPFTTDVVEVYNRVCDVARGAALMTGTEGEILFDKACSNLIPNNTLERVLQRAFVSLDLPHHTDQELSLAYDFAKTLPDNAKANELRFLRGLGNEGIEIYDHLMHVHLSDRIAPYAPSTFIAPVSTDVGDVSWIVPTAQVYTACWALGTVGHTWQAVAQGTTSYAHKGMLHAAKILSLATIQVMQDDSIINEAKAELNRRLSGTSYVCPIPRDVRPSLRR